MKIHNSYGTRNGGRILVPPERQQHLAAHPEIGNIIGEAIAQIVLPTDGSIFWGEIDLGRIVGTCGCVKARQIESIDPTTFALRKARAKPSRVAVGAEPAPCSTVVIRALPTDDPHTYMLYTCYVGIKAPLEPWDPELVGQPEAAREALEFWCSHALVHDPSVMGLPFTTSWTEILRG